MWRGQLVASVMLVACYAPTAPFGVPCGAGDACPSTQTCVQGRCLGVGASADAPHGDGVVDVGDGALGDAPIDGAVDAPIDMAIDGAVACPVGYTTLASLPSKYRAVSVGAAWLAAEQDCENDGTGTHLVVIDSAAEQAAIDAITGASGWIGLTDRAVDGTWRNVTGTLPTYTNWDGSPGTGASDCAGIYEPAQSKWVIGACTELIPFVCECDGIAAVPSAY